LLSTLLVHLCICYAVWCHLNHYAYAAHLTFTYSHGPCAQGYNFIPIAFGVMLYLIYIMECWHNRAKFNKIKKIGYTEAIEYIDKMRCAPPIVWWKSICYHYVRRTRQVTRYRNGDAITATQAFYERVSSYTAKNVFIYDICGAKDISKTLVDLDHYPVTKIRFSKGFLFACVQAANEFEEQRTRFLNENELRDDYMEVREGLDLAGLQFVDQMVVYSTSNQKCPWYFSEIAFWFFSIILLSWPLRLLCELRTAHVHYQISKLFGTNYLRLVTCHVHPSSINYTGSIGRSNTINSRDLEALAQRENYYAIPSYSEAILMSPAGTGQNNSMGSHNMISSGNMTTTNYGTIIHPYPISNALQSDIVRIVRRSITERIPIRSRSMNQILSRYSARVDPSRSSSSVPLPRTMNGSSRSLSIGEINAAWRSPGYESIEEEYTDDQRPLIASMRPIDEPPPSYEMALRMCAPIYERLRRSANSITSRLSSISHSNSKELSFRRQHNG
uniref:Transmembrane protein 151B n=1 Tax=Dracunculus medinensis TaxID=318479 RepID=A0A0N4UNW1_DRAME